MSGRLIDEQAMRAASIQSGVRPCECRRIIEAYEIARLKLNEASPEIVGLPNVDRVHHVAKAIWSELKATQAASWEELFQDGAPSPSADVIRKFTSAAKAAIAAAEVD